MTLVDCEDRKAGRCERYGIKAHWCKLCQGPDGESWRQAWEEGRGPGQLSSIKSIQRKNGPTVILVLGIHRTLSSCVAECLEKLGVWMGSRTNRGEDLSLASFCELALPFPRTDAKTSGRCGDYRRNKNARRKWFQTWLEIETKRAGDRPLGLKYPTLCAFADELAQVADLKVVYLQRPLVESIASLTDRSRKAEGHPSANPAECERLERFLDREAKRFLARRSYHTIRSTDLLSDPSHEITKLVEYLELTPSPKQFAQAVCHVDAAKARHSRPVQTPADRVAAKCQFLIKSFRRFGPLANLIQSIRTYYPRVEILVADDSYKREKEYPAGIVDQFVAPDVRTFLLPFDSGLSAGRNWLVQHASAPYVLILDDDYVFTEETRIDRFLDILEHDPMVDVVAGVLRHDGNQIVNWIGEIDLSQTVARNGETWRVPKVHALRSPWKCTPGGTRYRQTDIAWNFFLARRDFLLGCPWDEQFKISREHLDWLLTVKDHGGHLAFTSQVKADHLRQSAKGYRPFRQRTNVQMLLDKWRLTHLPAHNHTGECQSPLNVDGDQK